MDGLTFLKKLMRYQPMPVVIVSSLTPAGGDKALDALKLGAVDVMGKPGPGYTWVKMSAELVENVKAAAGVDVKRRGRTPTGAAPVKPKVIARGTPARKRQRIVAIGGSTGATVAIESILQSMPANAPGMVVTQHMPGIFTRRFAERLDAVSAMEVREACDGDALSPGVVLVAQGDHHLLVSRVGDSYRVRVKNGPFVNRHKPSVDVMFRSVARHAGPDAVGVILTGMGRAGARGLLEMRQAGAATVGQNEESCVVYGMPRAAREEGAVDTEMSLTNIPAQIIKLCNRR